MNFWVFMLCMIAAIFAGMVLDRVLIILARDKNEINDMIPNTDISFISEVGSFMTKEEAEVCINVMTELSKRQGVLRLYDLYLLMNIATSLGDVKYGWKNLSEFEIEQCGEKWTIKVPKPVLIEK